MAGLLGQESQQSQPDLARAEEPAPREAPAAVVSSSWVSVDHESQDISFDISCNSTSRCSGGAAAAARCLPSGCASSIALVTWTALESTHSMEPSFQGTGMSSGQATSTAPRKPILIGAAPPRPGRGLVIVLLVLLVLAGLRTEVRTSRVQAVATTDVARRLDYQVLGGKNPAPLAVVGGPYDERLGYDRLAEHVTALEGAGFEVIAQARATLQTERFAALGLPAIYPEKSRAGLAVLDRHGAPLSLARYPERAFERFDDVPPLVVETLLFIENRALLAPGFPYRSPVIEWPRLAHAALLQLLPNGTGRRPGASTLAIQIEKYRHSPGGLTSSVPEKLRQITAATLRAYQAGPDTRAARRRIVTDYVNTVPLAARAGFGEVHGVPDGLHAWFGADFREATRALNEGPLEARALAFRRVLSLFLAQRRPSHYLRGGRADLHALTDTYLDLLTEAGVIDSALRDAARAVRPGFRDGPYLDAGGSRPRPKAALAVRAQLLGWLDVPGAYDLDRMDLTVDTTLDGASQAGVSDLLRQLADPGGLGAQLLAPRLLEHGDPRDVVYSFLLYERVGNANVLRVQADTLDQPFDVNEGMMLDLGSTAKLRTLVHHLELVAAAFERHAGRTRAELAALEIDPRDTLTRFVVDTLRARPGIQLTQLVEAALDRRFSARPARFYTGGGSHFFGNFDDAFDGSAIPLRLALRHSVNLPFIRLMRESVRHLTFGPGGAGARALDDPDDPHRHALLERFIERESLAFLAGFERRYREGPALEREVRLARRARAGGFRQAVVYRSLHPDGDVAAFHRFLARVDPDARPHGDALRRWHAQADPWRLSLADRAYLTGLHPLELWLVDYWNQNPDAGSTELRRASAAVRSEVYTWLRRAGRRAQDLRIRAELERDAFERIHAAWARTGYPFPALVPSLATAIGSSADRPAALAELMGILQNDGLRHEARRIEAIRLGEATPFETRLRPVDGEPERVLRPEVARAVRSALLDVVANGTARRAHGALRDRSGDPLALGGKTGTGDNRRKRFASDGRLLSADVASRSATLAFFVGDRHFGVLTAYVEGEKAGAYDFTSSLPSQVLRLLAPALEPLLGEPEPAGMPALRPEPTGTRLAAR